MELLDRYLQAIEFWLPKRQRQDIIAELSEDLRSQIEEKETTLGRKLEDAEVEAILKRCGPGRWLCSSGDIAALPARSLRIAHRVWFLSGKARQTV